MLFLMIMEITEANPIANMIIANGIANPPNIPVIPDDISWNI